MFQVKNGLNKDALDVAVITDSGDTISDIVELSSNAGYRVVKEYTVNKKYKDSKYYVGKGKLETIRIDLVEKGIAFLIIDDVLSPNQKYLIESNLKVIKVMDRVDIILKIFDKHAHSEEAKLQVELAKLSYEIPLIKEYIHKWKEGEHAGFFSGGEYGIRSYYNVVKKRMKKIKDKLMVLDMNRKTQKKLRLESGKVTISIVGYTNAGKSSLFKMMTDNDVMIDNNLFTTLDTKSRFYDLFIVTDTVGFIRDLPDNIIDAFKSTYDDMFSSDLLLLMHDGSDYDDVYKIKVNTSSQLLLDYPKENIIPIISKKDIGINIDSKIALLKSIYINDVAVISTNNRADINLLWNYIKKLMFNYKLEIFIANNIKLEQIVELIYSCMIIEDIKNRSEGVTIHGFASRRSLNIIRSLGSENISFSFIGST